MRRSILGIALLLAAATALAQTAAVTRNVNLRAEPTTDSAVVRLLHPDETLTLVSPASTNRFFHVKTDQGEDGWVWSRNVHVELTESATVLTLTTSTPATAISSAWQHPPPHGSTFPNVDGPCGATGDGGDTTTNRLKNRMDEPSTAHDVAWDAIASLAYPQHMPKEFTEWKDHEDEILAYEGAAVRVVGYIAAIKPQNKKPGESTNCHSNKAAETDWHIALVQNFGDGEKTSIVVETTPRLRKKHTGWALAKLREWEDEDAPVRITGWLLFDPEHAGHIGRYRSTLWEVHPITKIEVLDENHHWVDLETVAHRAGTE